jgi:hypothetical protein
LDTFIADWCAAVIAALSIASRDRRDQRGGYQVIIMAMARVRISTDVAPSRMARSHRDKVVVIRDIAISTDTPN